MQVIYLMWTIYRDAQLIPALSKRYFDCKDYFYGDINYICTSI